MADELFSRKESVKDIFNIIESKLKKGLFKESMEDFDRIMYMDFECSNLYENISCVKFWINRLDKFNTVKNNCIEYCKLLDSTYKKFRAFIGNKSYNEDLISVNAIHYFVYNKTIELIMNKNTDDIEGSEELHLLSNAFIELKDYSMALKSYEYLNTIEPYNSNTLSFIAMIYDILGDKKKSKMYIRDALFYDPLKTPFIQKLAEVYVLETNDEVNKPMTIGGGTYAKEAKNTVAFGSHFPGKEDHIHEANEKIDLEDFYNSMSLYAHAIYALGNLK